jgi:predicted metal-dependent phosphoesterase TrpH
VCVTLKIPRRPNSIWTPRNDIKGTELTRCALSLTDGLVSAIHTMVRAIPRRSPPLVRRQESLGSFFDLHIHTSAGSSDSVLSPLNLVAEARRLGLTGALVTEHNGWERRNFEEFSKEHDTVLVRALEVNTEMGHVIALGLDGYASQFLRVRNLRKAVEEVGGYMIIAHPFRFLFESGSHTMRNILFDGAKTVPTRAEEAVSHPVFELVDEIEVVNGCNSESENRFAQEVARVLGKRGTGGSDAHSTQGIGRGSTLFHGDIRGEKDLLEALRAEAFTPVEGFNTGRISYYGDPPV